MDKYEARSIFEAKERTDIVVRTVARAEPRQHAISSATATLFVDKSHIPSSIVTSLTDGHTSQMCADTKHDQPLRLLRAGLVGLWVTERLPVRAPRLLDLVLGTVTDEDGLATPLDDDVLALRNAGEFDLYLGKCKNVGGRGHGLQELGDGGLCDGGGDDTHGTDHEVGKSAVVGF